MLNNEQELSMLKSKIIANKYLPKSKEMRLVNELELIPKTVGEQLMIAKINELTEVIQVLADIILWQKERPNNEATG